LNVKREGKEGKEEVEREKTIMEKSEAG